MFDALSPLTQPVLRECPDCGLLQTVPAMPRGAVAECGRCGRVLRRSRADPLRRPLAFAAAGLILLAIAVSEPFMRLTITGVSRSTVFTSGPAELNQFGMPQLALVVLATTLLVPLSKLLTTVWVLWGAHSGRAAPHMTRLFRVVAWLKPWAMVEVFLLGLFVAYTKLVDLARVDIGLAVYALGGLVLVMAAADASMDDEAVWARLPPRREAIPPRPGHRLGCDSCRLVCDEAEPGCPRCGATLRLRKRHSLSRTWALLIAATILYFPANVYPVLTLIRIGRGTPSTILGGVQDLAVAGMWPLAALVFVASICVPVFKIIGLTTLLVSVQRRAAGRLRRRTALFRVIEVIGRWSMIDVFMISILTALVRMGIVASVYPGPGVIAFCSVVILTMLSAACFDPRLMWDAADAPLPADQALIPA